MYIGYWWESQKKRDHYEDLNLRGKAMDLKRDRMGQYGLD
jgi:hypothetical protein